MEEKSLSNFVVREISRQLNLAIPQVRGTVQLLEEGNTIPFITRYRKEATGGLDEEQIQAIHDQKEYLTNLETRKQEILEKIREQGKCTPELEEQIQQATQLKTLEDLYLPFRPKRRTRAIIARERGLEPLAQIILANEDVDLQELAQQYVDPEKEVADVEAALQGARDIVAETVAENADTREQVRRITSADGSISSKKIKDAEDAEGIYQDYYEYQEQAAKIPPHRILALDRGEDESVLRVKVEIDEEQILAAIQQIFIKNPEAVTTPALLEAIRDGYKRLLAPAIAREVRQDLTQRAHEHAIGVFAQNLKNLLLQPPTKDMRVLAIDPGYASGCKLAALSETGELLEHGVIYPHQPKNQKTQASKIVEHFCREYQIGAIVIGNGTACRETEEFVAEFISQAKLDIVYTIVSEAGASVYSASAVARDEFPELDASYRGTISIGRRLLDPLAELVKIDPKSLGVGMYQHDLNSKQLEKALHRTVESCVNYVGVDVNRASAELLSYVAGVNRRSARNIIKRRRELGRFPSREALKSVSGIGDETFTQCAGFLRIINAENPLDNTAIHPESYEVCQQLLVSVGSDLDSLKSSSSLVALQFKIKQSNARQMAKKLNVGEPTMRDIYDNLLRPGRDPREQLPPPIFRKGVLTLDDLEPDMVLQGTVRNVVDFGAFVDIGVKMDGMVHISQMAKRFVKDPLEICKVGDIVEVKILKVDKQRGRISLSMVVD